jgi:hypothetical protein
MHPRDHVTTAEGGLVYCYQNNNHPFPLSDIQTQICLPALCADTVSEPVHRHTHTHTHTHTHGL